MGLPEDQKRIIMRSMMSTFNVRLSETAQRAGVIEPHDFATFQDHGYMGLYEGRHENDIHAHKHLQPEEKILDFMGSEELVANMFRATQADAKMKRDERTSQHYPLSCRTRGKGSNQAAGWHDAGRSTNT
jgi:DNA-damage-inducible protein D